MKGMGKKMLGLVLGLSLLVPAIVQAEEGDPSAEVKPVVETVTIMMKVGGMEMDVDGSKTTMDVAPVIMNGTTYIPLRYFAQGIGGVLDWDQKEMSATLKTTDMLATFRPGNSKIMLNGAAIELGIYISSQNDRTLVPVRAVGEMFGWTVQFKDNGIIYMTKSMEPAVAS
ncbi:copper amine oxidase N-terminal domain-containing protein [Paenibacillus mendelii]|uniref:Copper amine oxidase N-terminal domain-containing protein n=1 Tax=Paenibacillus mendelii TaxID=206163 RepID=A0ABV6J8P1_9BACL|nr:copper amine oxidase N-terminal domain-containing protein [Paenibacillus mendelii]MCQ6559594.1 copper amine oxidase N-terminal domain-containing protein [Paenibacillus mendelii]